MKTGIPTQYNGTNFRSRLEAKWARMFDLLGWSWEYEPFDMDGYIPDFVLQVPQYLSDRLKTFIVEIKPATNFYELRNMATDSQNEVLDSVIKTGKSALRIGSMLSLNGLPGCIGVGDIGIDEQGWISEAVGILIENGKYYLVPCNGFGCDDDVKAALPNVRELWAQAGNMTQYDRVFLANHKRSSQLIQKKPLPPLSKLKENSVDDDFFSPENIKLAQEWVANRQV